MLWNAFSVRARFYPVTLGRPLGAANPGLWYGTLSEFAARVAEYHNFVSGVSNAPFQKLVGGAALPNPVRAIDRESISRIVSMGQIAYSP